MSIKSMFLALATVLVFGASGLSAQAFQLSTLFTGGTTGGNGGNAFDITTGGTGISITRFDVKMSVTTAQVVNVYYKTGTYNGFATTPGAWTLHESVNTTGMGSATPTPVILTTNLNLNPGTLYGIAIIAQTTALPYSTQTSATNFVDANITLTTGCQVTTGFGATIANRIWNGTVYYTLNASNSTLLTTTTTGGIYTSPATNHVAMNMTASAFSTNYDINSITFNQIGSISDSNITSVKLFRDNNADGVVDGGDTQLASGTLTSGQVTFSGSPLQALTAGTPTKLLLAADVATGVTPGTGMRFRVNSGGVTWSGGTDLTTYPVTGGNWVLPDPNLPYHIYYKFNEATGTTTANSAVPGSGTSNPAFTGTVNWVTSGQKLGAAAIATGTTASATGQLETNWAPSLPASQAWTLETWFRTSYTSAVYLCGDTTASTWRMYFTGGGFSMLGGGFPTTVTTTQTGLYDGQWHHVAFVYNGAGTAIWYIDGTLDSTHNGLSPSISGTNFRIGSYTTTNYWRGDIDEFRVWNMARTAGEITAGMFSELPISDSSVISANVTKSKVTTPVTDHVVLDLTAYAFINNKNLNSVTFSRTGTAPDSDFTNIRLILDNNTNGVFDGGDTVAGTGTLSGGAMTISGAPLATLTAGGSARLLLAVNITSTLSPGTTFQFNATNASFSAGADLTSYPVIGANWAARTLLMPFSLYYKMNEGAGATTANGAVPGVGDDPATMGITTAPTWVNPGQVGAYALDFATGNGSGIKTGWTDGLSPNDDWTFETWLRISATTAGYLFRFQGGGMYLYQTGGAFTFYGTGAASNPSWAAPALNTWQHLAMVYNSTAGTVSIYLDGTLSNFLSGASPTGVGELIVGSYSTTSTRFYGQLDEFRLWDVARSAAEITGAMNIELPTSAATELTAASTGGTFAIVPANDLVVMDMRANAFVSNSSIASITFTQIGTAADTDLTSVDLHRDNNNNGLVDAGDTLLGSGTLSSGAVTFSGSPLQALTAGTPVRLLLAVDTIAGFTLNDTIQFQVSNSSSITWGGGAGLTAFPVIGGEWEYTTLVTRQFGGTTSSNSYPFGFPALSGRFQHAYAASELNMPAGSVIKEIRVSPTSNPGPTYGNLRVRLAHTTLAVNALTTTFDNNYAGNLATCLGPVNFAPTMDANGYLVFPLAIPFLYNGTDNLLIDWSYDTRSPGTTFYVSYNSAFPRSRVYVNGGGYLSATGTAAATGGDFLLQIDINYFAPTPQPVIGLSRAGAIANGGTDVIGNVPVVVGASFTWTIANSGPVNLNITTPVEARGGTGAPTVTVTTQPANSVSSSGSTTFTVQIFPSSGAFDFKVWITCDDLSDNPFVFTVSGTGIPPDMEVSRNTVAVPHTSTDTVGNVTTAGQSFTWTISNSGAGTLQITTPLSVTPGTGTPTVSVTQQPGNTVTQGNSTTFTINVTPAPGAFTFQVSIANNDPANNPYLFTVSGTGIAPNMDISRTGAIASAGTDNVGNVSTAGQSFTWTVANSGAINLNITTPISVTPGTGTPAYTVTSQPANTVTPSNSTSLIIFITPAAGAFDLQVSITSNDPVDNPYTFTIQGVGYVPNGPAQANAATGSIFTGPTNGPLTTAVMPGATLANASIELTDPEADSITVTAITLVTTAPTGITAPAVPGAGQPITLTWTGTADASNPAGDYTWEVAFQDAVNGALVTVDVTISIGDMPPTHQIANASSGDGSSANPYTAEYTQTMVSADDIDLASVTDPNMGQNLSISSVTPGGGNPAGGAGFTLTLTTATGGYLNVAPNGTLVAADVGTHTFDVDVTDGTNTTTISVAITVAALPVITTASPLPNGEQGAAYTPVNLATTGGTGTLTYSVTAGTLPAGMSVAANGTISGTPAAQGAYNFTVTVTDANNIAGNKPFAITIDPPATGNPTIITTTLPNGTLNQAYGPVSVVATGGTGTYTYTVSSGALPGGLALNPSTGAISGTPTSAGTFSFDVTATDSAFASDSQSLQITIFQGGGTGGGGGGGCSTETSGSPWLLLLSFVAAALCGIRMRRSHP